MRAQTGAIGARGNGQAADDQIQTPVNSHAIAMGAAAGVVTPTDLDFAAADGDGLPPRALLPPHARLHLDLVGEIGGVKNLQIERLDLGGVVAEDGGLEHAIGDQCREL